MKNIKTHPFYKNTIFHTTLQKNYIGNLKRIKKALLLRPPTNILPPHPALLRLLLHPNFRGNLQIPNFLKSDFFREIRNFYFSHYFRNFKIS